MGINPMTFQTAAMQATARVRSAVRSTVRKVRRKATTKVKRRVKKAAAGKARKFVKGSAQAKAFMAKLRRMQKRK